MMIKRYFLILLVGVMFADSKNMKYLLFSEDMYGKIEEGNYKKLFGKLDYSNLNTDRFFIIHDLDSNPIVAKVLLNLGEGYKISDKLYISIFDFVYKSADEFEEQKLSEPLGELKFIVEF